jgi:hypothetical protein
MSTRLLFRGSKDDWNRIAAMAANRSGAGVSENPAHPSKI